MKLLYTCFAMLVAVVIESGDAIECYECTGEPFNPSSQQGCFDTFNAAGIATVSCNGKCFANSTSATSAAGSFEQVQRGCEVNVENCPPTMCQSADNPDGSGSSKYCTYCCDTDTCNSIGFEEATDGQDAFSCWSCNVELPEGEEVMSPCNSPDFNGMEGAVPMACPGIDKCATIKSPADPDQGTPASFARSCNFGNACETLAAVPGFEVNCCSGNLCNVGSNVDLQATTAKPDDDDDNDDNEEGTIKCWSCDSMVTNNTAEQTACVNGTFPADKVMKVDCPSGTCISYTNLSPKQQFYRGCLTPEMNKMGYCDENDAIKDSECCTKDLCNENSAGIIAVHVTAMFCAVLISIGIM